MSQLQHAWLFIQAVLHPQPRLVLRLQPEQLSTTDNRAWSPRAGNISEVYQLLVVNAMHAHLGRHGANDETKALARGGACQRRGCPGELSCELCCFFKRPWGKEREVCREMLQSVTCRPCRAAGAEDGYVKGLSSTESVGEALLKHILEREPVSVRGVHEPVCLLVQCVNGAKAGCVLANVITMFADFFL